MHMIWLQRKTCCLDKYNSNYYCLLEGKIFGLFRKNAGYLRNPTGSIGKRVVRKEIMTDASKIILKCSFYFHTSKHKLTFT